MSGLLHGWAGILMGYAAVQGPMVAGLARARADIKQYVFSPTLAVPLTAVAGVAAAALGLHGSVQVAAATGISAILGYTGGKVITRGGPPNRVHQRGSLVAEQSRPAKVSSGRHSEGRGITLAGLEVPARDETKHFKLIGTTGTGKSTAIQEILHGALARGDRAVIADPDGGYLRRFYRPERGDVILNPFDERSVKWDLFAEIRNTHDVEQLARSLIPDHDGQDRSWRGYARTFFTAVTRQARGGGVSDVGELYRLLVVAEPEELRALLHGTPAQPFLDKDNGRMFDSIRSVASSAVGSLEYVSRQKGAEFSVRDWVGEEKPGVLFIPYKAGEIAALHSTISGWMRLAIFETMDRGEQKAGLWFVVDELDALGQIDGLKDALARLRKFNGRCVLGFQSIAQVSSTYGQGDAHTIVENCGNTLILRCSASEGGGTARFASQLIGEREVMRTTVSTSSRANERWESVSRNEHFAVEAAVLPSQVEQLPDLSGYLKYASDPTWQRVRLEAKNAWNEIKSNPNEARPARDRQTGFDHE
jgi:Type IV secretion-system coupling protein DNA-binding domain